MQVPRFTLKQHTPSLFRGTYIQHLGLREELLRSLHAVARVAERTAEVEVRQGLVGLQGNCRAVGLGRLAPVPLGGVPRTLSHQLPSAWPHSSPVLSAIWATRSAVSRFRCCAAPPSSHFSRRFSSSLCHLLCFLHAAGLAGQSGPQIYVAGRFSAAQRGHTWNFGTPSSSGGGRRTPGSAPPTAASYSVESKLPVSSVRRSSDPRAWPSAGDWEAPG